ncbi:hypothetical protein NIES22_08330 [Calothrix brevissima NIES-22]|nr:hypothetical protein NIES22_08330 [Calothrix brevissima NIES-22]
MANKPTITELYQFKIQNSEFKIKKARYHQALSMFICSILFYWCYLYKSTIHHFLITNYELRISNYLPCPIGATSASVLVGGAGSSVPKR